MSFPFKFFIVQSELQKMILISWMISEHKGSSKMIIPISGAPLESQYRSQKYMNPLATATGSRRVCHILYFNLYLVVVFVSLFLLLFFR